MKQPRTAAATLVVYHMVYIEEKRVSLLGFATFTGLDCISPRVDHNSQTVSCSSNGNQAQIIKTVILLLGFSTLYLTLFFFPVQQ